jgi:Na+-transporting NADH:ubiquinone oxidoreductase subunit E
MWIGHETPLSLLGLLFQSVFIENFILANFLGMCTYLACSSRLKTANGLGMAVVFVMTISGILNWLIHAFITGPKALSWLSWFGLNVSGLKLDFLEFLLFITIIAGFVQITEIFTERFAPQLYMTLGIYLPLITVNCAILGAVLFAVAREYAFLPNLIYVTGSGLGWWLAIVLIAHIRIKLTTSDIIPSLRGMGIAFIATGLMALAFTGFSGIKLGEKQKAAHTNSQAGEMATTECSCIPYSLQETISASEK